MNRTAELNEEAPHGYRAYGTTEDITDCWHCGKAGLRKTVKMRFLDADGNEYGETYIGSDCAARLLAGKTDRKLATAIMRKAEAADLKRRQAVSFSRDFLAYYAPFITRREDGTERLGGFIREYTRLNKTGLLPDFSEVARASLARHREVIATNGESAL